jgi:hypothetical protein
MLKRKLYQGVGEMSKTKWMSILGVIALVATIYLVISARSGEELFIDGALNAIVLAVFSESTHSFFGGLLNLGIQLELRLLH